MAKYKVSIPENVEEQLDLATRVAARHALDGASSILNNLQGFPGTAWRPRFRPAWPTTATPKTSGGR